MQERTWSKLLKYFVKECKNKLDDAKCDQYASLGYCIGQLYEDLFIQCKRSCGFCSEYTLSLPKFHYYYDWYLRITSNF